MRKAQNDHSQQGSEPIFQPVSRKYPVRCPSYPAIHDSYFTPSLRAIAIGNRALPRRQPSRKAWGWGKKRPISKVHFTIAAIDRSCKCQTIYPRKRNLRRFLNRANDNGKSRVPASHLFEREPQAQTDPLRVDTCLFGETGGLIWRALFVESDGWESREMALVFRVLSPESWVF